MTIRHNLNTSKEVARPAFFQLIAPADSTTTVVIGAALKVNAITTDLMDFGPFVEYQRNTALDKELNTFKAGFDAEWQLSPVGPGLGANSPILLAQANYKSDAVKDSKGIEGAIALTWMSIGGVGPFPNTTLVLGSLGNFVYSPHVGLEYDNTISAAPDTTVVGDVEGANLRAVGIFEAFFFPAGASIDNRVELFVSYAGRWDLTQHDGIDKGWHDLLEVGLNYYFVRTPTRRAGIGISYSNGEDPKAALADQETWQLAFKLQI